MWHLERRIKLTEWDELARQISLEKATNICLTLDLVPTQMFKNNKLSSWDLAESRLWKENKSSYLLATHDQLFFISYKTERIWKIDKK